MRSHLRTVSGCWFALLVLLLVTAARAEPLKVWVVDPAHTDAGDAVVAALAPGSGVDVRKVDVTELRGTAPPAGGVVIWLSPEPTLYEGEARQRWQQIVGDKNIGMMILGLPHDQAGREKLVEALRPRIEFTVGPSLDRHLSGAKWIWTSKTPKDDETAVLRKTFELKSPPARAWVQIAADNRATVSVNGTKLGTSDDWRRPAAFDLSKLLRAGENEITIEAWNQDGPGGVVAALSGSDESGREVFRVLTDESWPGAVVIAPFGDGEWGELVRDSYAADEYALERAAHEIVRGAAGDIGRSVLLHPLLPADQKAVVLRAGKIAAAVAGDGAGGRAVVFAGEMEKTSPAGDAPPFSQAYLGPFVRSALRWLARSDAPQPMLKQQPPPPASQPVKTLDRATFFPVTMQFSPVPYEGTVTPTEFPQTSSALHRIIDNLIDHGCTVLQCPLPLPDEQARDVEAYAQARGMGITYLFEHGLEGFSRDKPPKFPIYSAKYKQDLIKRLDDKLKVLDRYPNLMYVLPMQDEPFHAGVESFDYRPEEQQALKVWPDYKPVSKPRTMDDPEWENFIDTNSRDYQFAWFTMYQEIKRLYPRVQVILNHDSHNVFGGAVGQEGKQFIDDVYHWGGNFADVLSFDIYPYLMKDFRYGPNRTLMRPRMSQMHYALAHMANVVRDEENRHPQPGFRKRLGYYFGTYNPEWFDLTAKGRDQWWMSRETAYTAVAAGADELLAGLNVPIDWRHWKDLGDALRTLQRASPALRATRHGHGEAAMLFPRSQCVNVQEEYWNVATSFEMFQRAFGELDLIHEDQVSTDLKLYNCRLLTLFDVKRVKSWVGDDIEKFVRDGGVVVADCVPTAAEATPQELGDLFGVRDAKTGRILWPVKLKPEIDSDKPATMPAATRPSDAVRGSAFGRAFDFPIVSPRPCAVTDGEVLLKTAAGQPAVVRKKIGKGSTYLLGFCLQDTAFEAWRTDDRKTLSQLYGLLHAITEDAGVRPQVRSSNPEVEAAIRRDPEPAFLIVVAHEPSDPKTTVTVRFWRAAPKGVTDVASGEAVPFAVDGGAISIDLHVPNGTTRLLRLER